MKPSQCSYAFLGSFISAIFLVQWWQKASYPQEGWLVLGLLGLLGLFGFFIAKSKNASGFLLAATLGLSLALFTVSRTDTYATEKLTVPTALSEYKYRFETQINRLLPEPHAAFMAGLLTGSRQSMSKRLTADFRRTGLSHITAISGYNITMVIALISSVLFWLPLKWRFLPAVCAIAAFTMFVGAGASVVRAAVMGTLGLLALQTGREQDTRLAILWTAFFMLLWNPEYLWNDASFQLSFLAVAGLNELQPLLKPWLHPLPKVAGLRENLTITLAAQLTAAPWAAFLFHQLPVLSPLSNVLVAPAIPFAMLFGFLATILSFLWFPLGIAVAYVAWGFLQWIIVVAETLSAFPFASFDIVLPTAAIIVYYAALILTTYRYRSSSPASPMAWRLPVPVGDAENGTRGR